MSKDSILGKKYQTKMKSGKRHMEDEEEEEVEEEFSAKKESTSSANNIKDGKSSEKANVVRSKHSVTEQRRRSKINERFQMLRELIPHSDQKRDTASFLLEVIQYVQFLQEKVQKYEGSYQPWDSEPTKLMPWRNSQWRVPSSVSQPQTAKNGSATGSAFPGRFDENSGEVPVPMQPGDTSADPLVELPNASLSMPLPIPVSMTSDDALSAEFPITADGINRQDELAIEGGTISVSSPYSEGLLSALTQALESTGLDLSRATITVQINLGKRANVGATPKPTLPIAAAEDHIIPTPSSSQPAGTFRDAGTGPGSGEGLDLPQKRQKI